MVAAGGWCRVIDWCDATFLSEVMSLLYCKAFVWWLYLEVSQEAVLNKLSTGRAMAFPGIIKQMRDSYAFHLPFSSFTSSFTDTEFKFCWRKEGGKSRRMSQRTSPAKHFEGYLILTRGRFRERGLSQRVCVLLASALQTGRQPSMTGRGLVVCALIPAPAITLSAP